MSDKRKEAVERLRDDSLHGRIERLILGDDCPNRLVLQADAYEREVRERIAELLDDGDVIADETNGIVADAPLVDVATILREADDGSLRLKAFAYDPHSLTKLADMVERDYVSREVYDSLKKLSTDSDAWLKRKVDELKSRHCPHYHVDEHYCDVHETRINALTAERDELKTMNEKLQAALDAVDGCDERCKKLEAERDEWKAKAEQAQESYLDAKSDRDEWKAKCLGAMNDADDYRALWQRKGSGKSAKRAAAVERLNSVEQATDENLLDAILGVPNWMTLYGAEKLVALKALLTDDDGKTTANPLQDDGMDSREKLEEAAWEYDASYAEPNEHGAIAEAILGLLDRQASITCAERNRHWMEIVGASASANAELKRQIDELTLRAVGAEEEADELQAIVDRLQADRKPTDSVREFAERYESRITWLRMEADEQRCRAEDAERRLDAIAIIAEGGDAE